jgi:selenide,water dikinase
MSTGGDRNLVLIGGGHAHIHVLERCIEQGPPNARLTLVVDRRIAVYSGMVPGYVAGQYRAEELEIDAVALAERAGAHVVLSPAVGVDPAGRRILVEDGPPVPYDLVSFDIGSTVIGLDVPGVREHSLPTRPIGTFVEQISGVVDAARRGDGDDPYQVVVVGGGVGGIELAFTIDQRLRADTGRAPKVVLLEHGPRILSRYPRSLLRRVLRNAEARGIQIRCNQEVVGAEAGSVSLRDGSRVACDALIWVTGPTSHPLFRDSDVVTDDRGFALIRPTLQLRDHDQIFAVGDCATFIDYPETPKAGVYAVREGAYITDNLYAALEGQPLRSYKPQGDFLTLLNLGDGRALGAKWGLTFEGRWVMTWKDRIDRKFMLRFQALAGERPPAA